LRSAMVSVLRAGKRASRNSESKREGHPLGCPSLLERIVKAAAGPVWKGGAGERADDIFFTTDIKKRRSKADFDPTWHARRDSNPQLQVPETCALSIELRTHDTYIV